MNALTLADYIADLERAARSASISEEDLRREVARRFAELERDRQFAYRRYNLMRAVTQAVSATKDEEQALAKGQAAFMRELDWAGATELQRRVTERFTPVVLATWHAADAPEDATPDIGAVANALAAFEHGFAESNNASFMNLLEQHTEAEPHLVHAIG